ncbi:hypothetical protein AGMMS50256_07200 [Betaproteobacteria bacterium]|nr:hypothetical protein AGMMS50256_07200 [Betaproteobacteria bacterium]
MYRYSTELIMNGHQLMLELPEFPAGQHRVRVVVTEEDALPAPVETQPDLYRYSDDKIKAIVAAARANRPSDEAPLSDDFFAWYDRQPLGPHSEEEIAAWIREERDAWGDD